MVWNDEEITYRIKENQGIPIKQYFVPVISLFELKNIASFILKRLQKPTRFSYREKTMESFTEIF